MHFIVKYFPEITIKTPPVRKRFMTQLHRNLRKALNTLDGEIEVIKGWDRLEVRAPGADEALGEQIARVLAGTPGIANFSPVTQLSFTDLDDLCEQVGGIWLPRLPGHSFCVRAKRKGEHPFNSQEVERSVGAYLNRRCDSARVQLKDPDITVKLEIVDDGCFVLLHQQPGLGGFPLGTQDHVMSLVSGGFDSTVASYLTNKRGMLTHFCFFNLGGRAHELGVKEVSYYLWRRYGISHSVKFVTVPFEDVVAEIMNKVHHSQMGVVLKRMMLRAASRVAEDLGMQALVTGESVAQVSSQTLANLGVIDSVTDALVLRPLITMDKGAIIDISRDIGTEEFAVNMPEYCGVISVKPTTRATRERIEKEESAFDWQVLEQAYADRRIVPIEAVASDLAMDKTVQPPETGHPEGAVVIDIRHPQEEENRPLSLSEAAIKKIPFYQLNSCFDQLDRNAQYLLYCDKGVMSKLHAAHLLEAGYTNVGVYRPDD